eukprot:1553513-Pyramimonas_sp.AAC.1
MKSLWNPGQIAPWDRSREQQPCSFLFWCPETRTCLGDSNSTSGTLGTYIPENEACRWRIRTKSGNGGDARGRGSVAVALRCSVEKGCRRAEWVLEFKLHALSAFPA